MSENDIQYEPQLRIIRRRRLWVFIVAAIVMITALISMKMGVTDEYLFVIFTGGIALLMGIMSYVGVSTCPRCHQNFFGSFYQIERNKCKHCGLLIKHNK